MVGRPPALQDTPNIPQSNSNFLIKSNSTPAIKHTTPKFDTYGQQCSLLRTAKFSRANKGEPHVDPPKRWSYHPLTRTQSQLKMQRRDNRREVGKRQLATTNFVNSAMQNHKLFGPDPTEKKTSEQKQPSNPYKLRSPFYVEYGVGGGPKSTTLMSTRSSLLRHRREDLSKKNEIGKTQYEKMLQKTAKLYSNMPETGRKPFDSRVVKERIGRTQSEILSKRHDEARQKAKLSVKPTDLFDRSANRSTPTLKYLDRPKTATKTEMNRTRKMKLLSDIEDSTNRLKEQRAVVEARREKARKTRTGGFGRTQSMVFKERKANNLKEARQFIPPEKKLIQFGTEVPWWKQAKANTRKNDGSLSSRRVRKGGGIRRPKSARIWSYNDPFKKHLVTSEERMDRRRRRGGLAPKISQVNHSKLHSSRPKSAIPLGNKTKRWTDANIEFRQEEEKMGGKVSGTDTWNVLDKKGKKKRFEPGEQDPLFSSFAKDGIFRDPLVTLRKGGTRTKRPQSARLPQTHTHLHHKEKNVAKTKLHTSASTSAIPKTKTKLHTSASTSAIPST